MRALRKTKKCLNCKIPLSDVYDFCPMCGQQNDDKNVSFRNLSRDLVENFFSFDSRLAHSIVPFFFQPGHLTSAYNEGKRFRFANPIRMYIIVSVFYFFVVSMMAGDASRNLDTQLGTPEVDSLQTTILTELVDEPDSAMRDQPAISIEADSPADLWPLDGDQWELFIKMSNVEKISDKEFYDTLHVENRNSFTQTVVKQMIRVVKKDKEYLISQIVKNLSMMMFVMIPVFALLLKLLYVRSKILYINHLIHTIHIHTFAFFVYGWGMLILYWTSSNGSLEDWIVFCSIVIVGVYAYFSFLHVYHQSWKKTMVKFLLTGFVYSWVILIALLIEISISFMMF